MTAQAPFHPDGGAPPLTAHEPARLTSATIFSSPHSGRDYPAAFVAASRLTPLLLRSSEDAFVDELFAEAPRFGAPLLAARFPRAWLDANRAPDDLDPQLIEGLPPGAGRGGRSAAGLGVAPRLVAEGRRIYAGRISYAEALSRVERCHRPYHEALERLLGRARTRFGTAVLIDCHSMPSDVAPPQGGRRPDIVLGDLRGRSAGAALSERAARLFREAGFLVARNAPFAGGYITERHGAPAAGVHAIQIEISRGLYMDEARVEPLAGFEALRARLRPVIAGLSTLAQEAGLGLAAE